MADSIKLLNMGSIFEVITGGLPDKEENEIDKILAAIEQQEEFNKMFFYSNKETYQYYYLESQEKEIKEYISKQVDISRAVNDEYCFRDFSAELNENRTLDTIKFKTHIGTITIQEDNIIDALIDEYLTEEDYIERLVNAEDFEQEMKDLKRECLLYLFEMQVDIIKNEQLEKYQFEYFA